MAFKKTQSPTFTTTVTVNVPNENGGFSPSTFVGKFKRHSTSELQALRDANLTNEEVVRRVLVGWKMDDEDTGEDVPYTPENRDAVLQVSPTPYATAQAFWESANGARSKN